MKFYFYRVIFCRLGVTREKIMKRLFIIFPLLLIIGCSTNIDFKIQSGKKTVNFKSLLERSGLYYEINSEKPFSGTVFIKYESGQYELKGSLKKGKWDDLTTEYYENGQKKKEKIYKAGNMVSKKEWGKDGSSKE